MGAWKLRLVVAVVQQVVVGVAQLRADVVGQWLVVAWPVVVGQWPVVVGQWRVVV